MKRIIDQHLEDWKNSPYRKPLLLRGARQVGKTHAVRQLARKFNSFVELNFEFDVGVKNIFDKDLDPLRIIQELSFIAKKQIVPGETLLFFDEIQGAPQAVIALRYFYEKLPALHVIAAGSLLDFTTQKVGIPVGRVSSLYMYPMSFYEFLCAGRHGLLAQALLTHPANKPISESMHERTLGLLGEYFAIGGMPEAVLRWYETRNPALCFSIHQTLIDTYRQDFNKYAKQHQIKYLDVIFRSVPQQLGRKFKYTAVEGDYRKRELSPCVDLLTTAGIINPITKTAGNGVPLGAEADPSNFKLIFLDIALNQAILGFDLSTWLTDPQQEFINKGALTEAFVGQEMLAYAHPEQKKNLFYWQRNAHGSEAEVDYLIQRQDQIVPIEVKSGFGSTLRSMHMFLETHQQSTYGLRFSTQNYSVHEKIHSYPLYGLTGVLSYNPQKLIIS
jgi:predicted AAA+ superfamily ATPase